MRRRARSIAAATASSSGPVATNPPPWRSKCARERPPRRIPSTNLRHAHLVEITARAQRVQAYPVAHLAGEAQHGRSDRGDRHRHRGQPGRFRRKIRGHQAEPVMLALIVEPLAGFPAPPHRAQRADVVAQAGRRRTPWNTKASFVMAFDLAAEPEDEPPIRIRVQIPGLARHDRGAAWKRDGDRRRQLDPGGGERGEGERRKRLVAELDRHHRVKAGRLRRGGEWSGFAPIPDRQGGKDPHHRAGTMARFSPPPAVARAITRIRNSENHKVPCHHSCQMP